MRQVTVNKLADKIELEPFEYQARYWGSVAVRRNALVEASLMYNSRFNLKFYTELGFVVDHKKDSYELTVLDDTTAVIENHGKAMELPIDTLVDIIQGNKSDKVLREMEVINSEINHG
ncbi:hypothetical protein UT300012_24170 [Paraclostridium bifermentans]